MLCLLLNLTLAFAEAPPILFKAPSVDDAEYRARLGADEAFRTPTAAYLDDHPTARSREILSQRVARAQRAFLDGDAEEAHRLFTEVVLLVPTDDWSDEQREVFLLAYLRLAQLEAAGPERDRWLTESLYLGPDLKVDASLIPPPVRTRWREIERRIARVNVPAVEGGGLVLINGARCTPRACPSWPAPAHRVRVTLVSDGFAPETHHVDLAELGRLRPARHAWVSGDCARPSLSPAARALGTGRAFVGLACEMPALAPPPEPSLAPNFAPSPHGGSVELPRPPPPPTRPFYRSPWLWAGIGVAVVTAVTLGITRANSARHASPPPPKEHAAEPAVTYGY